MEYSSSILQHSSLIQDGMVYIIKTVFYIALNKPFCLDKLVLDLHQGCVTAMVGLKFIRIAQNLLS